MRISQRTILVAVLITILLTTVEGCTTLSFYTQAIVGQTSLLWQRKDIKLIIDDPATDEHTREKLELVVRVLAYAEHELSLPVDDAYSTYVATGNPYIVWNVFAAPEFSLEMELSCYPIVGCVSYQGYFKEEGAQRFASGLRDQGRDVFVGGVAAYSTLGWFSDPVLDTFLVRSDINIARLLFHELAHRVVFVPGDTQFNESFATAIEESSLQRWLADRQKQVEFEDYLDSKKRRSQVLMLINTTRSKLAVNYASGENDDRRRVKKQQLIDQMRVEYKLLKQSWEGEQDFQYWMESDVNNAKLGTIADYNAWVPAFQQILMENGNSLELFFAAVELLAAMDKQERDEYLGKKLELTL